MCLLRSGSAGSLLKSIQKLATNHAERKISQTGQPAPVRISRRWVNAPKKLNKKSFQEREQLFDFTLLKKSEKSSQLVRSNPLFISKQKFTPCREHRRHVLLEPLQRDSTRPEDHIPSPQQGPRTVKQVLEPMEAYIQFITTPTADTPGTTLLFHLNKQRYLFGSGSEGTQRAVAQAALRLQKVEDFFITGRSEWGNLGGLIGMMLTLADSRTTAYATSMELYQNKVAAGKAVRSTEPLPPKLNLYGPPNLNHMMATCRRYIFRKGMPITATEYKDEVPKQTDNGGILPTWKDDNINVWALSVVPTRSSPDTQSEATLNTRKQSFDERHNNFEGEKPAALESAGERELRYNRIRKSIVRHMFDSDWRFDTLVERHISEVEMPAAMYVRNSKTKELESYKGPLPGSEEPLPDIKVLTRTPWPGALVQYLPPTKPAPEAVSYIARTHSLRGKFKPDRAKDLGVKPGPDFSKLASGESVQNEDGQTITPDMVLEPERPGQGVAIFDVPSVEYIDPLINREELSSNSVMQGIQAYIWILGRGVSGHPALQEFMQTRSQVQHVVSSVDDCPNRLTLDSVAAQTIRLGQIDGERYSVPFHDNATLPQKSLHGSLLRKKPTLSGTIGADRGLKFNLMPKSQLIKEEVVPLLDVPAVESTTSQDIIDLAKAAREDVENGKEALEAWKQKIPNPDAEVITLGTGSALPSKYRNVSATLVRVPGVGNYLFDCGENTLGQLQRVFNPEELAEVLRNLRMIWISHLHADHHLGTTSVIKAWYAIVHNSVPANSPPNIPSLATCVSVYGLSIISDEGMLKWLSEYSSVEDFGYSRIVPLEISNAFSLGSFIGSKLELCSLETAAYEGEYALKKADYQAVLGLSDIQACAVPHCRGAKAVSITFPETSSESNAETKTGPLKISYSGDCRPSSNFARIGRNTTVLIHEATFDDELLADAKAKKHSTTSEALGIGAKMDAKAVVLTHFSQRYQKIPVLETVENGEAEHDIVDSVAMEDAKEEPEEEDDADPTADNMDMTARNVGAAPQTKSLDNLHSLSKEQVIKVRSKDMKVAVAFDYMHVKIGEIAQLEKFNPALNKLLTKADEEAEVSFDGDGERNGNGKKKNGGGDGERGKKKKAKRNN
ncbi:hypothetical protein K469DRAFT_744655 [Zopfia rhizophila CBS 207.26]|uniref:ribonuclease Z n=1 Tax=Zopfia rhizophila CBS 207.26 TaxID=1314779 RepID=A0A6A6EVT5_9PEZI|nr:hypothetical protein K469DRAFT_744655 [Zopfia rhizophila CBS 207.26]